MKEVCVCVNHSMSRIIECGCFLEVFTLVARMDKSSKAHSRIIWACSWSHDDHCFATVSRDKKV